jgi:hypothetical protein
METDGGVNRREDAVQSGCFVAGSLRSVCQVLVVFFVFLADGELVGELVDERGDGAATGVGLSCF